MSPASRAAITAIDSVSLGTSNELLTATVGGTAFGGGTIADYAESGQNNEFDSPTVGAAVPTGAQIEPTSAEQRQAFDNDVLTGVGGGAGGSLTGSGGMLALYWNFGAGGFTDNDADPDFFVFEDLGNDAVDVYAILSDNTLGAAVSLSGWNTVRTDGVLFAPDVTGRSVAGVSFSFTDLLDAGGTPLTNGTAINGILIGDPGAADFYEVYANVSPIPEPSVSLLGFATMMILVGRRRRG